MLIRVITVIFSIFILFNITNISIILKELTKKNKPRIIYINNEIRIGQVSKNGNNIGYSITEYQNNNENISFFLFRKKHILYTKKYNYVFSEYKYKPISNIPYISLPLNKDDDSIIISFNISNDETKRIITNKNNNEILIIKEYQYSKSIHNKFQRLFGKYKFNPNKIYHEIISSIHKD